MPKTKIPHKFQPWIRVRRQFQLSHAHVQMARELGLEPRKFGSYANVVDQPWKQPLPQFIETLYEKRFGRSRPEAVRSIEDIAAAHVAKRLARKKARQADAKPNPSVTEAQPPVTEAQSPVTEAQSPVTEAQTPARSPAVNELAQNANAVTPPDPVADPPPRDSPRPLTPWEMATRHK